MNVTREIIRRCKCDAWVVALAFGLITPAHHAAWADPVLFVGDTSQDAIRAFDTSSGTAAAGFTDISLPFVTGLAIGPGGNLFAVGDQGAGPHVFRYDATSGAALGTYVTYQTGAPGGHDVFGPQGIGFSPAGDLYVADVTPSNIHVYGSMDDSLAILNHVDLVQPRDVAFDLAGNMYTISSALVLRADAGTIPSGVDPVYTLFAPLTGGLIDPSRITVGPDGKLYVLDITSSGGPVIRRYTTAGVSEGDFVSYAAEPFAPADLEFGPDGKLYVAGQDLNLATGQVLRYLADGTPDGGFATGLPNPSFIAFAAVPEVGSAALLAVVAPLAWLARLACRTGRN
jgi:hypothetical protein